MFCLQCSGSQLPASLEQVSHPAPATAHSWIWDTYSCEHYGQERWDGGILLPTGQRGHVFVLVAMGLLTIVCIPHYYLCGHGPSAWVPLGRPHITLLCGGAQAHCGWAPSPPYHAPLASGPWGLLMQVKTLPSLQLKALLWPF